MDPEEVGPILQNACKRDAQHAATLAVDLALSTRILSSEPLPTAKPIDAEAARPALTPEDVLQRAAKLTLDEEGPPKVSLHYLPEAAVLDDEEGLPRPDIQIPTIRHLLSEWAPSADPKDYAWKSWVDPPDGDRPLEQTSTQTRPIRPLPSPRGSPRPSQYAAPVFAPTASRTLGIPSLYQPRAYTQASQPFLRRLGRKAYRSSCRTHNAWRVRALPRRLPLSLARDGRRMSARLYGDKRRGRQRRSRGVWQRRRRGGRLRRLRGVHLEADRRARERRRRSQRRGWAGSRNHGA